MNICVPVEADNGLNSPVCAHFGSAPAFIIVDTDTGGCRAIVNDNQHHGHGMCMPLQMLQGEPIDAMVVGGIGMGALNKLGAAHELGMHKSTLFRKVQQLGIELPGPDGRSHAEAPATTDARKSD